MPRGVPREGGAEGSPGRRLCGAGSGPAGSGTRPGNLSCPFTVTLQNSGAEAVTMTMAGQGGSRGVRLGAALLGAERRARRSRTEESQGRLAATAMEEAEDRSIHTQHISAVHNVPMRVLIRPIPAVLEPGKVQSLMETLQVSPAPGMQRQPLLHPFTAGEAVSTQALAQSGRGVSGKVGSGGVCCSCMSLPLPRRIPSGCPPSMCSGSKAVRAAITSIPSGAATATLPTRRSAGRPSPPRSSPPPSATSVPTSAPPRLTCASAAPRECPSVPSVPVGSDP